MPLKCCVPQCKGNYDSNSTKLSVYRFPKNEEERLKWVKVIPRANLIVTKYTVVCRKHWPCDAKFASVHGEECPVDPPSIFPCVPSSCLSTPLPEPRPTKRARLFVRTQQPDEIQQFQKQDSLDLNEIEKNLSENDDVVAFKIKGSAVIQSAKYICGVPLYVIKLQEDFSFQAYHCGASCTITTLGANKIFQCKSWSCLHEIIRFLQNKEIGHKKEVLFSNLNALGKNQLEK